MYGMVCVVYVTLYSAIVANVSNALEMSLEMPVDNALVLGNLCEYRHK